MKRNNLFFIICFLLLLIFGCSTSMDSRKADILMNKITLSCDKIHSGQGTYTYKYGKLSNYLLKIKDIKSTNSDFIKLYPQENLIVNTFKNYIFFKNNFKFEFEPAVNKNKYFAYGISDGYNIKSMKFISSESNDSNSTNDIIDIFLKPNRSGHPEVFDPLFFPEKKILASFSAYNNKELNLRGIKEEKFEGKKYTVISFGIRNSFEKYYIDTLGDYKIFFIKKFVRDFKSTNSELVRIKYQLINNLSFPEHIIRYKVSNGIIMDYQELIFNKDWKLNIVIPDNVFDPETIHEMQIFSKNK